MQQNNLQVHHEAIGGDSVWVDLAGIEHHHEEYRTTICSATLTCIPARFTFKDTT